MKPEKSLRDIDGQQFMRSFQVNALVTAIIARDFLPLLRHPGPSCLATLSAKVGSIADNQLGGWYAYRASKAALNMIIKNASLEYQRRSSKARVLAIHPGTTITELSKPYIARTKLKLHSTDETASNILSVIDGRPLSDSGLFLSWDGSTLPW